MSVINIRVVQDPSRFGYQLQIGADGPQGSKAVATEIVFTQIKPGEAIPEAAMNEVSSESLVEFGKFLIGQGLITAPVTERERKEHEALKIRYEALERENQMLLDAAGTTNRTLERVCETLERVIPKKE